MIELSVVSCKVPYKSNMKIHKLLMVFFCFQLAKSQVRTVMFKAKKNSGFYASSTSPAATIVSIYFSKPFKNLLYSLSVDINALRTRAVKATNSRIKNAVLEDFKEQMTWLLLRHSLQRWTVGTHLGFMT